MRIGILGGTFNPIHLGHLLLADEVRDKLKLDKVIFIPTYLPPHKSGTGLLSADKRMRLVKLAVKSNAYFEVSDIEIKRGDKSYSIDTVRQLKQEYPPEAKFFFITGSDSIKLLSEWKNIDELTRLAKFVVASRLNYPLSSRNGENLSKKILPLVIESLDISGARIRERIKNNESVRYLLPKEVYDYIVQNKLYK